jgi:TLC domain
MRFVCGVRTVPRQTPDCITVINPHDGEGFASADLNEGVDGAAPQFLEPLFADDADRAAVAFSFRAGQREDSLKNSAVVDNGTISWMVAGPSGSTEASPGPAGRRITRLWFFRAPSDAPPQDCQPTGFEAPMRYALAHLNTGRMRPDGSARTRLFLCWDTEDSQQQDVRTTPAQTTPADGLGSRARGPETSLRGDFEEWFSPRVRKALWITTASGVSFGFGHWCINRLLSTTPTAPAAKNAVGGLRGALAAGGPAFWLWLREKCAHAFSLTQKELYIVDAMRRREITLYILSQVHAGYTVWWSAKQILDRGGIRTVFAQDGETKFSKEEAWARAGTVCGLSLGYFLHDLAALIRTGLWRDDYATVFHHILGISIMGGLNATGIFAERVADGLILETSTLFLNAGWLLREFGRKDTKKGKFAIFGFITTFFLFRVLYFPWMIQRIRSEFREEWKSFGKLTWTIYAAQLLQVRASQGGAFVTFR